MKRFGITLFGLAAALALTPVTHAGSKVSQDELLAAVRQGQARPLADIEEALRGKLPGEVIKVEIEREKGSYIYEFKTLDARGRRHDVYVDAKTGDILEIERK